MEVAKERTKDCFKTTNTLFSIRSFGFHLYLTIFLGSYRLINFIFDHIFLVRFCLWFLSISFFLLLFIYFSCLSFVYFLLALSVSVSKYTGLWFFLIRSLLLVPSRKPISPSSLLSRFFLVHSLLFVLSRFFLSRWSISHFFFLFHSSSLVDSS